MTPISFAVAYYFLPPTFDIAVPSHDPTKDFDTKIVKNWYLFVCVAAGLWGGLAIGLQTEFFTSNRYKPVQARHRRRARDVADACRTGPATDIIFGLALGYKSTIIPCFVIAICIYVGNTLGGMLGIACAALGMLSTLSTGLAIDA
ncbi:Pyrophosphate-energized vacuolar membrane proton pump [Monoraphidium neglectum]|uniref:H(+)-exporting diphosphatase n=1 Tax=Monoraphidium neglectum TaxID=145388 RepID=A0A0D2K6A6_9CHLO|nr:Pyrophosphate-energized vacuolar membrane proton pump [Monoraphidium neglectum]KIY91678.1 Pyrophosphate-energized vacuolar membrane proton pump [Monoraphidium neglectum]|eukprot:XP_013890698.1 Pyrophosphate-energized vacuolar membrane proton pump [Monoraphidium neglectum]